MDSITELNDLLCDNQSLFDSSNHFSGLKNKNECENRRENIQVNKQILQSTMHEWTPIIENQHNGASKRKNEIEIANNGEKHLMKNHNEYNFQENKLGSDIMNILYSDKKPVQNNSEDKYVEDISHLKTQRSNRIYHEQMMAKNRMGRKIKSKNFHRHMKRREIKEYLKKEENLKTQNPDSFKEKLAEFEMIRAKERISLKHKVGGKFAKIQKLRAKYDPNAREALNAMHEKGQELTKRNGDDSNSSEEEKDEEEIDEEEEEHVEDISDDEEMMSGTNNVLINSNNHKAKTFVERNGSAAKRTSEKISAVISTSQSKFLNYDDNLDDSEDVFTTDEDRFKQAIYQVYQEDSELAAEFEREKNELVELEKPKDIQLFQPGWGTWTGAGYEAADERRKKKSIIKAPDVQRKDKKKTRVWIRQGVHDGLKKHLIKSIPFPYNTVDQFNLSRKELVSGVFNLQTVHREIIKPKFVNKAGQPIYPIQKHEKSS